MKEQGTMMKRALILGVGGMDGSHLADLLLEKGYEVHGFHRRSSVNNLYRIVHLRGRITLHLGDMADAGSVERTIRTVRPHEIYNEADQDHVGASFESPAYSWDITAGAVVRLLETVRRVDAEAKIIDTEGWDGRIRVFQPLSATMFQGGEWLLGKCSAILPNSPYAVAKLAAWEICKLYRRRWGLHVSCGIMFNHDGPRRGKNYLLQRICRGEGISGNLKLQVDIGYAADYMDAAWRLLQLPQPTDTIIATGEGWSIEDIIHEAVRQGAPAVKIDQYPYRTDEAELIGDPAEAKELIGWEARSRMPDLIRMILREAKR